MKLNLIESPLIVILTIFGVLQTQGGDIYPQAASTINPIPFEMPEAFTSIETDTPLKLFNEIIDTVMNHGFNIKRLDRDNFELDARRGVENDSKEEDRIIIWLNRDNEKPMKKMNVFFQYGWFEELWERDEIEMFRVKISEDFEEIRIGKLKEAILKISLR